MGLWRNIFFSVLDTKVFSLESSLGDSLHFKDWWWAVYFMLCGTNNKEPNSMMFENNLRKQPTSRHATTGFPAKWRLRNEHKNSILMTHHYPDLGSASVLIGWSKFFTWHDRSKALPTVTRHRNGISALVSQTSFGGETSQGVAKCRLFSQAGLKLLNSVCESNEMNQDHQKWSLVWNRKAK